MNSIHKTWFNQHIDLSHILSISDAVFHDRMGYGGFYVEFNIEFILRDKPITYSFETQKDLRMGFNAHAYDEFKSQAVELVQNNINNLIVEWKNYKLSTLN